MDNTARQCKAIIYSKLLGYNEALELQSQYFEAVKENDDNGVVMFLQHKPVLTYGKNAGDGNLLVSRAALETMGIELAETNRGGDITYHGPGQLVVYPILNLKKFKQDTHWYLRQLEEVIIRVLGKYDIKAQRRPHYTGVWIGERKITAVGIHVRKWITMHGLGFNVEVNKDHFGLITPCGISEFGISSLDDYLETVVFEDVLQDVIEGFEEVFEMELIKVNQS